MMEGVLVTLNVGLLWQKLHSTRWGALFSSTLNLKLRKKSVKCYIWSTALYGAETGTLRAVRCIRCGPDEERILDVVPREDGARNSG